MTIVALLAALFLGLQTAIYAGVLFPLMLFLDQAHRLRIHENVAALFCMPLRCTAFDCYSEVARTP